MLEAFFLLRTRKKPKSAIRARPATPPTTPPAIAPVFDPPPLPRVGVVLGVDVIDVCILIVALTEEVVGEGACVLSGVSIANKNYPTAVSAISNREVGANTRTPYILSCCGVEGVIVVTGFDIGPVGDSSAQRDEHRKCALWGDYIGWTIQGPDRPRVKATALAGSTCRNQLVWDT